MPTAIQFLRSHPWTRRAAWALGGLLVLWALAWLAVPYVARTQLERVASEQLGRKVTVGRVEFMPWSLELSVHDLAIATAEGSAAQLQVKRIYIDAELQSLLRLAPVADALQVDEPVLRLAQTAPGHYDIDDILQRLADRPAPAEPSEPQRFALYNIAVRGGAVDFDDQVVGRTHTLRQAELSVPFLSNLSAHREIKVAPRLAFLLNGSRFDSAALTTPFTDDHRTQARLQLEGFDLGPFVAYVPGTVPVKLQSGLLDADLELAFEQAESPSVGIRGRLALRDVKITDASQRDLIAFDALRVQLADVQPLKQLVRIESVALDGLRGELRRNADGAVALPGMAGGTGAPAGTPAPDASPAWDVALARLAVRNAQLGWTDAHLPGGGARWDVRNLRLQASAIAWPLRNPLQFQGSAELAGGGAPSAEARLAFAGEATDRQGKVAASVRQLPLELAAPYLAQWVTPRLGGVLETDLGMAWNGAAMAAKVANLALDGVALSCAGRGECSALQEAGVAARGKNTLMELQRLEVADALVDLRRSSVAVERIALTQPRLLVARDAQAHWMFEQWMVAPAASSAPAAEREGGAAAPWSLRVADASVAGGAVAFRDAANAQPVAVNLSALQLRLRDFAPLAAKAAPSPLSFSARIGAGRSEPGRIGYEGTLGLAPVAVQGRVQASHVPLHAFEPYIADTLNVDIVRAEGSFAGDVRYAAGDAGASVLVRGDASLDEVRVRSVSADPAAPTALRGLGGDELLNWKSLGLRGIDVALAPGKPVSVDIKETALSDFFARIIVQESGRINLQDLRKAADPEAAPAPASAAAPPSAGDDPVIRFGPVTLTGGSVRFTDHFVKPNYSADLSELAGRLSAFSSVAPPGDAGPQMADLELRGRAEGTASLEIVGKLNPLAKPLALDIQGHMRDLELPPLSPYSIKYAGHGIERGKLSMDVTYRVLPDGQLTASNKLVLNQLAFGDPVEGAPASLPVRLAVALLADRNGVIDVDLPISGSLNDPEFRLGSVILRVIGNLIMKAVTAPFSLLAGAFGGSDELGMVHFAPGSAALSAEAREGLDKVAKALTDRPALRMTVAGEARLVDERDAWKRERLQALVQAQKRRLAVRAGQAADQVGPVTAQEYPALLKEVYRRADIDKPRNLVGMAKDLPEAEMEALLLASIPVPDNAMQELAVARGVAVRDYLASRQVSLDRLFVGAAKTAPADDKWVPHASLALAER